MPVSLKNRLLQFEAVPPAGAWEKIAMQLDEEFVSSDASLSVKLANATMQPPAALWGNIEAELDGTTVIAKPAKVIPVYRRIAVAAAVVGVLMAGSLFFLNSNRVPDEEASAVNQPSSSRSIPEDSSNDLMADNNPGNLSASSAPVKELPSAAQSKSSSIRKRMEPSQNQARQASFTDIDIEDPKPVQVVSAMEPVQVGAPPIRDAGGNVIMDLSLISHPDEPYITVTSPSGSQTNISKKFLNCLSYLNGDYSGSEINYEGQQWKSRFAEWRNKLTEAGFVPGASNFFDIFELQDLIQD